MPNFQHSPERWTPDMWQEVIKAVVRFGEQRGENLDDIVTAGWLLGQKRAEILHREFWPGTEPQVPLMILCWWPLKPKYHEDVRKSIIAQRGGS